MVMTSERTHLVPSKPPLVYSTTPDPADRPRRSELVDADTPTLFREFTYAGGRWTDRSLAPPTAPRGKARMGQIYVLADVEGPDSDATVEYLRQAVADNFYRDTSRSLTSALVRAIQQANQGLYAENERAVRAERQHATICCVVFRGDDAYFALAGHGLSYLIRTDHGERFGRGKPRPGEQPPALVGQTDEIDVELHYRALERPTAIILTSFGLLDLVGEHSNDALRGRPDRVVDGLRAIGQGHQGERAFRALVVVPDIEATGATEKAVGAEDGPADTRTDLPLPESPLDDPSWSSGFDAEQEEAPEPKRRTRIRPHWPPRSFLLPRRRSRLALGIILVAALFLIGYMAVMITARIVQGGAPYTNAMSKLTQAEQRESEAMGQSDPLVRRHLLTQANQLASQALAARPNDPLTITVSGRIQREYQAASGMVDLPSPKPLLTLPAVSDQLILNGNELYALDRTNSRLYKYLLNADGTAAQPQSGASPVLLQQGDRIGSVTVGKLTRIAWMPADPGKTNGALLALDSSGFLIQYEPVHGLTVLRLNNSGSWSHLTAIAADASHLYALDAADQTLASYPAESGGFDGPVYNYLKDASAVKLSDAVDLAVSGDLYLLHSTGQIQRFVAGKPAAFAGPPSDMVPSKPAGLALTQNAVFVGDPTRARIIQLSRSGVYQRELSDLANPEILAHLRDLAVADGGKDLYVLSGATVYRFSLPEPSP